MRGVVYFDGAGVAAALGALAAWPAGGLALATASAPGLDRRRRPGSAAVASGV
jgi:hypothetical protein